MKQVINLSQFHDSFRSMGRKDQFSYKGLNKLFEYLEDTERTYGVEYELDVIGLCCEFSEIDIKDIESETGCKTLEELKDTTNVIEVDDETIIYEVF